MLYTQMDAKGTHFVERPRSGVVLCCVCRTVSTVHMVVILVMEGGSLPYLGLVALHLLLQEGLPGHLLQLLSQVLTRLHVGLGDVLGQVLCNTTT